MKITMQNDTMMITDFCEFEAYRIALSIEEQGLHFYQKLLECIQKDEVKSMLKFLIEEEKKHLTFFENALTDLRQEREDTDEDNDLVATLDFGIFMPYEEMKDMSQVIDNVEKALQLGILIENKTVTFYQTCRDHVVSEDTKKELDHIIDEEKRHKELFQKILEIEKKS